MDITKNKNLGLLIRLYVSFESLSSLGGETQRPRINAQGRATSSPRFCNHIHFDFNHGNEAIRIVKEEILNFLSPSHLFSLINLSTNKMREKG